MRKLKQFMVTAVAMAMVVVIGSSITASAKTLKVAKDPKSKLPITKVETFHEPLVRANYFTLSNPEIATMKLRKDGDYDITLYGYMDLRIFHNLDEKKYEWEFGGEVGERLQIGLTKINGKSCIEITGDGVASKGAYFKLNIKQGKKVVDVIKFYITEKPQTLLTPKGGTFSDTKRDEFVAEVNKKRKAEGLSQIAIDPASQAQTEARAKKLAVDYWTNFLGNGKKMVNSNNYEGCFEEIKILEDGSFASGKEGFERMESDIDFSGLGVSDDVINLGVAFFKHGKSEYIYVNYYEQSYIDNLNSSAEENSNTNDTEDYDNYY